MYCLQGCIGALFSPEILQSGAVKGLSQCHEAWQKEKKKRKKKSIAMVVAVCC